MNPAHQQSEYRVRFDWGLAGAARILPGADVAVVIDVLSFTTSVTVALDLGITVLPYRWNDDTAQDYAERHGAVLARHRAEVGAEAGAGAGAGAGAASLSPASLRLIAPPRRLVLPSPNGSAITYSMGASGVDCVAASLRNGAAASRWIADRGTTDSCTVALVAAGELGTDGTLRPAVEDAWGAGAIIAGLSAAGWTSLSPEAELALGAHLVIRGREQTGLLGCASGRELVASGYREDIEIAAEVDGSALVPVLVDGQFLPG